VNMLKEGWDTLKDGFQENWGKEVLLNGTQNSKAVPGIDALVSTAPSAGTIGGIDASVASWWRNHAELGISTTTAGNLLAKLEALWRKCVTTGKMGAPDFIPVGSDAYDALQKDALAVV